MRAKYARRGLAHAGQVDPTTQVLLLRQLYLSHLESHRFCDALAIADQMLALDVMGDVVRQDAARACLGLGEVDRAVDHLRLASRCSPASRRAFHLWTMGSVLYLHGREAEAAHAFARAARWGTRDRPLYHAQLALARRAAAGGPSDPMTMASLQGALNALAEVPCGQGYGEFVRGELAFALGRHEEARDLLDAFVTRTAGGRPALAIALEAEIVRARGILAKLRPRRRREPNGAH
ncbi:MAG: tetratricopeptide repeat protein [Polyangiaceae bacterium]|nr:tetratricopeptide repeat protein [Polyangiaceae bacterium]